MVGAHLNASRVQSRSADADWVAHQLARDSLTAMITAAGPQPVPAPVAYQLPVRSRLRRRPGHSRCILEEKVAQAYLGLVALPEHSLRALGARELTAAALRAAAWRRATVAFPGLPGAGKPERGRRLTASRGRGGPVADSGHRRISRQRLVRARS